jgi:hypothetical protein
LRSYLKIKKFILQSWMSLFNPAFTDQ